MRALIVKDEPCMAEASRDGPRLEASAAGTSGDGDNALQLYRVRAYDIVVVDGDIPDPPATRSPNASLLRATAGLILMLTAAGVGCRIITHPDTGRKGGDRA